MASGAGGGRRDVFHPHRRPRPRLRAVHRRDHRRHRQFRLLRSPAPALARPDEIDRVSTAGYALGYLGGGRAPGAQPRLDPEAGVVRPPHGPGLTNRRRPCPSARLPSVAVWWVLFSIPLFRRVPEPPRTLEPDDLTATHTAMNSSVSSKPIRAVLETRFAQLYRALAKLHTQGLVRVRVIGPRWRTRTKTVFRHRTRAKRPGTVDA